jgi:hypothetical protein
MLLGQCSLCQGQAATATYLKTDPAMNGLEVRTNTVANNIKDVRKWKNKRKKNQ